MDPVDYVDTFIALADDSTAAEGTAPPSRKGDPSVAARTFAMIAEHPYRFTSGDVIFTVFADRRGIAKGERAAARNAFYSQSQACLRASPLGKRYGWGIHADADGRIALVGVESAEYADFVSGRYLRASGAPLTITKAMRSTLKQAPGPALGWPGVRSKRRTPTTRIFPPHMADDRTISREDVAHLANLARIDLTDDELDHLAPQLAVILDAVARVSEVACDDVPPMSHAVPLVNVTRPDETQPGLSAEEVLAAAPASAQQRFRVPRILDEET